MLKTYQDLRVWQIAADLAEHIYHLTKDFPQDERFGLTSQMRRAAVSVVSNIAEGYRRDSMVDRKRFVSYAFGSASELEAQLCLAKRFGFCQQSQALLEQTEGCLSHTLALINLYQKSLKEF
jgi:four helix bundle protein